MKKITVLAFMLVFAFSLTACDLLQKDTDVMDESETSENISVGLTIGEGSSSDGETVPVGLTIAEGGLDAEVPVGLIINE